MDRDEYARRVAERSRKVWPAWKTVWLYLSAAFWVLILLLSVK